MALNNNDSLTRVWKMNSWKLICYQVQDLIIYLGQSWSWSYDNWIYNYICNLCLSPLTLWVRTPLRRGVLNTTLCVKVCGWLTAGRWFSPNTSVSSANKTDRHDIAKILLKLDLSTINQTKLWYISWKNHCPLMKTRKNNY